MKRTGLISLLLLVLTAISAVRAQTPAPIIVQAVVPGQVAVPATTPPASNPAEFSSGIELLHQMEAANAELLKKQQATLATLDELQKAVEELKIFSKRG
jgi:hypothetical protein